MPAKNSTKSASAVASENTETTAENAEKDGRGRKPTDFNRVGTIVLSVHNASGATVNPESEAEKIATAFQGSGYATRVVHQTREGHPDGMVFRVQIAPAGFDFPVTQAAGGARISSEAAAILRQIAGATGKSVDDVLAMALQKLVGTDQ